TPKRVDAGHVYNQYTISSDRRDSLRDALKAQHIGCEIYYPLALHLQVCFRDLGYAAGSFPRAERATREVLSLPIFAELGEERQRRVVDAVVQHLRND